jgi:UDP-N-acetylglucosamine acyltransferase
MSKIHPTAVIHPTAILGEGVEIGPYSVIEQDVSIGGGSILLGHATIRRYTTLGQNNLVDSYVVLGGLPQDLKFDPDTVSYLRIGDNNVFREGVTISRATGEGENTFVGNRTYWMAGSHAGHNAAIEDEAILVNGAALAGHTTLGRGAILSAHVLVHQFCWIGEGAMSQGKAGTSMHVPPFCLFGGINRVISLNSIGLRRSNEISQVDRKQIREAFNITYRKGLNIKRALQEMDERTDWGPPAILFRDFIRRAVSAPAPYRRGICPLRLYDVEKRDGGQGE